MIGMLVDEMYKILDELSRDDRGITYLARVLMTDEVVDIKFLKLTVEQMPGEARRRFQREMSLLGSLRDRHIARLYKHGEYDGRHYMVFEHLAGISLRTVIELMCQRRSAPGSCLDEERALRIARQVADGLAYAHEHKVIHRGLSPEAILLGNDGLVKIVDFRFAKQPGGLDITSPGVVALKPTPYLAPEQRRGEESSASDIYALGAILYELLTGSPPGQGVPIEPPGVHLPTLNPNVEDFIMRCLAEAPANRYATGREALDELNAVMPHTGKTDSGPFATGGDSILASLVEQVSQWREFRPKLPTRHAAKEPAVPTATHPSRFQAWIETENGRHIGLEKTLARLGRPSPKDGIYPDIPFDLPWVHRRFLQFECKAGIWHVRKEAGARNEAKLNGELLGPDDSRYLSDGDVITLGSGEKTLSFTFHCKRGK